MEPSGADQDRAAVLTEIVLRNTGIDGAGLSPHTRVADLGVDSIVAAEILSQAEQEIGVEIDYARLLADWSTMTVGELVSQLEEAAVPIE